MKLSILVCTLPEEYSYQKLGRLNAILDPQLARFPQVEKLINDRPRTMPTGTKRNLLVKDSDGEYFSFIDCDDVPHKNYVEWMLEGIELNPDVVTFNGWMTTNGTSHVDFIIKLGEDYVERGGKYYRFPNHLCAMKRETVGHVKFKDIWQGEDYMYAKHINDNKILKTEYHIDRQIYHYDFWTNKPKI